MKVRFYSDIHNECRKHQTHPYDDSDDYPSEFSYHYRIPALPDDKDTVLLLGGDIDDNLDSLEVFVTRLCERFRHVFYVTGNHEYYVEPMEHFNDGVGGIMDRVHNFTAFIPSERIGVLIEDVWFCGGTLWTDMDDMNPARSMSIVNGMMDYRLIRKDCISYKEFIKMRQRLLAGDMNSDEYWAISDYRSKNLITQKDVYEMHREDANNICNELILPVFGTRKKVVLTHHYPTEIDFPYGHQCDMTRDMTYAFNCTDCDDLVKMADYWFSGHGHNVGQVNKLGCEVIANAVGYGRYESLPTRHEAWEI